MRLIPLHKGTAVAVFVLAFAVAALAAESPASDPFATDEDDLFSFDEDALFGSGGDLLVEVDETTESALEETFLVSEGIEAGGTYQLGIDAGWTRADGSGPDGTMHSLNAAIGGSLFFDARPSRHFRAFVKAKGDAQVSEGGPTETALQLHEAFIDFAANDKAFFRAGKQTVHWGVGYFFSPADIINTGRIDPENPEAEREGPVALRLNVPSGTTNLDVYAVFDGQSARGSAALAPKLEFVTGGSEMGLGLYYRPDRAPRAMATLSTSLRGVNLFGEWMLSKGSDKRFVEDVSVTPAHPLGLAVVEEAEALFTHATAGVRFTYTDPDRRYTLSGAGQYYYNGEGYDGGFIKENRAGLLQLLGLGKLARTDVMSTGRHYGAISFSWARQRLTHLTPSLLWLGNASDGSGMLSLSLGYTGWDDIRPTVKISRTYGEAGSEYVPFRPATRLTVGVTLRGRF